MRCPRCDGELAAAKLSPARIPDDVPGPFLYCPADDLVVTVASGTPVAVPLPG